jgi:hypothetical protein
MLSPDRQQFWDGTRWNSAVTPDGAWRWDGSSWVPARRTSGMSDRVAVAIAAGAIAALLLGGAGLAFVARFANTQASHLQAGLGAACTGSADRAGSHLFRGETVCGRLLGTPYVTAECAAGRGLPGGVEADQLGAHETDSTPATVIVDSQGCVLTTPAGGEIRLGSTDPQPPDLVVVADFVPSVAVGGVGVQLACESNGCINVAAYADGNYFVDEYAPSGTWSHITRGVLPIQTLGFRVGQTNRLVVRFNGSRVDVFLNGYMVVRSTPKNVQHEGYVNFYVDGRDRTAPDTVHLRELDAFGAL